MNTERSIEQLLKLAGERELPSAAGMERAREAASESWQRMLRDAPARAPRRGAWVALTAAASVVLIAVVAFRPSNHVAMQAAARVVSIQGGAVLHHGADGTVLLPATDVMTGNTIETSNGRVVLTLGNSLSLRINRYTRLRLDSPSDVTLLAGDVYVDSGGVNAGGHLRIETPSGEVRHVGTQFQVSVAGVNTKVRVREGRVVFTPLDAGAPRDIAAGDELRIVEGRMSMTRGLASFGAEWEWAAALAPSFDIEGRPLAEFLAWAAREHGWQLRYSNETLQQQTYEIRLHGALDQTSAEAMVERVSLITGVPLAARDGVLWVGAAR
jgi:ferric-dicitrate binding protein FerR (iron transport regulator)